MGICLRFGADVVRVLNNSCCGMGKKPKLLARSDRFKRIRSLKCFQEVCDRLRAGWVLSDVARYIQDDRKELTNMTQLTLVQRLSSFRKTMPPVELVSKRFPDVFEKAKARVDSSIDELGELEELYRIQKHRISLGHTAEKEQNKLAHSMTSEIREARNILESLANLKMDMGFLRRVPKGVEVNVTEDVLVEQVVGKFGDGVVGDVLSNPESRRKVLGVVERFMKLPEADLSSDDSSDKSES